MLAGGWGGHRDGGRRLRAPRSGGPAEMPVSRGDVTCTYICIYIYIDIYREKERERERDIIYIYIYIERER